MAATRTRTTRLRKTLPHPGRFQNAMEVSTPKVATRPAASKTAIGVANISTEKKGGGGRKIIEDKKNYATENYNELLWRLP